MEGRGWELMLERSEEEVYMDSGIWDEMTTDSAE
jgi:hypothetical protein